MKIILIFLLLTINIYSQDTTYFGKDFIVRKDGKIIEKNFQSSDNKIKIVYQYNEFGILTRRYWYSNEGKLLSVCLDD